MKKLLLFLFSLMLCFNSYGGSHLDFTLSDFCYQQPNVQDRGGVYYFPNESEGITAISLCVYKGAYGQYMSKVELVNGKFDGKQTEWFENGQIKSELNYKDGKLDGKWIKWRSDGLIWKKAVFKNGKIVGNCEYLNQPLPIDTGLPEGFSLGDECPPKDQQKKNELEAERAAQQEAFETEQYLRLLTQKVQDQLKTLKTAYVHNIAARVKTFWRYQGADDDWTCEAYVQQDENGNVEAVRIQNCNAGDSAKAKAFKNSLERAIYKASPLPSAPDEDVFTKELLFEFHAN